MPLLGNRTVINLFGWKVVSVMNLIVIWKLRDTGIDGICNLRGSLLSAIWIGLHTGFGRNPFIFKCIKWVNFIAIIPLEWKKIIAPCALQYAKELEPPLHLFMVASTAFSDNKE